MDFRNVDVGSLRWSQTARGWNVNDKIRVQVPRCPCRVYPMRGTYSSGWTLDLQLRDADAACSAFADFVETLTKSAAEVAPSHLEASGLGRRFDGRSLRVTAFSDTHVFDEQGSLVDASNLAPAAALTVVLELQGVWTSASRWGVRWKVLQAKIHPGDAITTPASGRVGVAGGATDSYAFID